MYVSVGICPRVQGLGSKMCSPIQGMFFRSPTLFNRTYSDLIMHTVVAVVSALAFGKILGNY